MPRLIISIETKTSFNNNQNELYLCIKQIQRQLASKSNELKGNIEYVNYNLNSNPGN